MNATIETPAAVKLATLEGSVHGLPLGLAPAGDASLSALENDLKTNAEWYARQLTQTGALLFRGFQINNAEDFERIARAIDPDLKNNYLGTSPRLARSQSGYVFSASELPPFYPIMQHCEMSFLPDPPRKLFFFCETAPEKYGETPVCDFRRVWNQLNPNIRAEFEQKGVRTIRNYTGPENTSKFQMRQLKRWDELLGTTDPREAERKCEEYGYQYRWTGEGRLQIINEQEAFRLHPVTGEKVWFNHVQVFHVAAAAIEYQKIAKLRPEIRNLFYNIVTSATGWLQTLTADADSHPMHCTFRDGSEIPASYVQHLLNVIWQNLAIVPWRRGDVLAIDNLSVSHGRLPYAGPREILVCWAAEE